MMCIKPVIITKNLDKNKYPDGLEVPCGKCILCRIAKRSEWTMRCQHELSTQGCAIWLTLTYAIDPQDYSLQKEDLRRFFKKLRKIDSSRKFKYLAVGEYGEKGDRPHYHVILYGYNSASADDRNIIERAWQRNGSTIGHVHFGNVEKDSIQYTLKYCTKQLDGELAQKEYGERTRPFKWQSQGLGLDFAEQNKEQFEELLGVPEGGKVRNMPRYYLQKLGIQKEKIEQKGKQLKSKEIQKIFKNCGIKIDDNKDEMRLYKYSTEKFMTYYMRKNLQNRQKGLDALSRIYRKKESI